MELKGNIFTDQTGKFPITSSKVNTYIMNMYIHDPNAILAEPMKSRSQHEIVRAQIKLHNLLTNRGFTPQVQVLDSECPAALKQYFVARGITFQLVLPYMHRTNSAKRAIVTFKYHMITGLSSTNGSFSIHLWCRLIPLAITTLNLLRASRLHLHLYTDAVLNGAFDYNTTHIAPPGTKVIVHETPSTCATWAPHGVDEWYISNVPEYYVLLMPQYVCPRNTW